MKPLLLAGALALALLAAPVLEPLAALASALAALALLAALADTGLAPPLPLFTADVILHGVMMFRAVLAPLLAFGLRSVVNRLLDLVEKVCGFHFDAKHRAALNDAIEDGVRVILAHGEPVVAQTIAAHASAGNVGKATRLVLGLAPSAIAHLGVTTEDIGGLVAARLGDVIGDPTPAGCPTCGVADAAGCARQPCGLAAPAAPDLPNPLAAVAEGAGTLFRGGLLPG